ncbi:MAG: 16S rRNA (cytidine(1402)-2'-O)-methyltransferase [Longimicrobiales bacterium]|nr:16S rRNA (cytidine(1402)-2'-O)-methyltransferase [Longimicrobiales bacterium]
MATLYLVSTPIGNLDDLSPRAAETLTSVHRILAEDTRRSRILTDRVGASAPLVSLHAHNERERIEAIVEWLDAGEEVALVTDAGTPLVSDPGGRVVAAVVEAGHDVVPIPGPSAVLAALVASGLPAERFTFLGFVARKGRQREADLARIAQAEESIVLFESPHRLVRLLEELDGLCGEDRRVAVARELTKLHEEFVRGTLREAAAYYEEHPPKGEVTVVVGPRDPDEAVVDVEAEAQRLARELLDGGMRPSTVAKEVSTRLDLARNEAYRIVHDLQGSQEG